MSDPSNQSADSPLAQALKKHCASLANTPIDPGCDERVAESLAVTIELLKRMSQAMIGELEVLGRSNPRIKQMHEAITSQGLLDFEAALEATLAPGETRVTRLTHCAELMLRWFSAVVAGIQTTILEVPGELHAALNPDGWEVEKKMWKSQEAALWEHFKLAIRPEMPLRIGDQLKTLQAKKSLDAFAAMTQVQLGSAPQE